jgi:hypothetical protein
MFPFFKEFARRSGKNYWSQDHESRRQFEPRTIFQNDHDILNVASLFLPKITRKKIT